MKCCSPNVEEFTFAVVRIDSLTFCPVRDVSYLYATMSTPLVGFTGITVSLAALLAAFPDELEPLLRDTLAELEPVRPDWPDGPT